MKRYVVSYQRTRIMVPYPRNPRRGRCISCKRTKDGGEITRTQLHHAYYAYATETVKKNPLLALKNTLESCYPCHKIADGFRALLDGTNIERVLMVFKVLPRQQQRKFIILARKIIKWWEKTGRNQ